MEKTVDEEMSKKVNEIELYKKEIEILNMKYKLSESKYTLFQQRFTEIINSLNPHQDPNQNVAGVDAIATLVHHIGQLEETISSYKQKVGSLEASHQTASSSSPSSSEKEMTLDILLKNISTLEDVIEQRDNTISILVQRIKEIDPAHEQFFLQSLQEGDDYYEDDDLDSNAFNEDDDDDVYNFEETYQDIYIPPQPSQQPQQSQPPQEKKSLSINAVEYIPKSASLSQPVQQQKPAVGEQQKPEQQQQQQQQQQQKPEQQQQQSPTPVNTGNQK